MTAALIDEARYSLSPTLRFEDVVITRNTSSGRQSRRDDLSSVPSMFVSLEVKVLYPT